MLIEFSEFNLKLLLFLIYPVFIRIQDFSSEAYIKEDKDNMLFITFRCYLSFILSGIPLLIFKMKTKTKNTIKPEPKLNINEDDKDKNELNEIDIQLQKIKRIKIIKKILFLFLLSMHGLFSFYASFYFDSSDYSYSKYSVRTFFQITNFSVLSHFLLNQKLYKHHFISYGSITIMLIIIFIISYSYFKKLLFAVIYYFVSELIFGLYDIFIKMYTNVFYETPYFIMFYVGIINTISLLIFDIIAYFVNPSISGIIIGFQDNIENAGNFFLFILDLIIEYIWNLGIWILIYYFSPCHYFISDYASEYLYFILKRFKKKDPFFHDNINYIFMIICGIFIFIFSLVFNEVIIINFKNLDYNTNKRIKEREKIEKNISSHEMFQLMNDTVSNEE